MQDPAGAGGPSFRHAPTVPAGYRAAKLHALHGIFVVVLEASLGPLLCERCALLAELSSLEGVNRRLAHKTPRPNELPSERRSSQGRVVSERPPSLNARFEYRPQGASETCKPLALQP